ncbi:MAG: pyruvate, water dikinase regulatory protein [Lutisporaceae bacterium]|jgi:regulator of PEP synthase PpsR (kinase-PPPase family)
MNKNRAVIFVISDSIGETAEQVARAASAQYPECEIRIRWIPYVTEIESIQEVISEAKDLDSIIMFTLVVPELREYLTKQAALHNIACVDIMGPAVEAIAKVTGQHPTDIPGALRKLDDEYFRKIEAMEFSVKYDDCKDPRGIKKADLVLLGISRTSKTPLGMFLATKNLKVANIPLMPEVKPPKELFEISPKKIIGLVISPDQLNSIRLERLKTHGLSGQANYASKERIAYEQKYAEEIMSKIGCRIVDVTDKAIEETANIILQILKEANEE